MHGKCNSKALHKDYLDAGAGSTEMGVSDKTLLDSFLYFTVFFVHLLLQGALLDFKESSIISRVF